MRALYAKKQQQRSREILKELKSRHVISRRVTHLSYFNLLRISIPLVYVDRYFFASPYFIICSTSEQTYMLHFLKDELALLLLLHVI